MVSKTVICVLLLAVVAVCYGMPTRQGMQQGQQNQQQQQQRGCGNQHNLNNSEERDQPCREQRQWQHDFQGKGQNIHVQDTSSGESKEYRRVRIVNSEESNSDESKELRQAPKPKPVHYNQEGGYQRGQQSILNEWQPKNGQQEINSQENNSQQHRNQIHKY